MRHLVVTPHRTSRKRDRREGHFGRKTTSALVLLTRLKLGGVDFGTPTVNLNKDVGN